ncbi:MAG TPA: hypothetical protein VFK40_03250, partial [Nitrososphaeraceae archaeon]|nr:hypothetical protein [Nitrososphaeraceae archaeon]
IGYSFFPIQFSFISNINYLKNREITYRDNRKINVIKPNKINKIVYFSKSLSFSFCIFGNSLG